MDHAGPAPVRWKARQARPTSRKLCHENTALVATFAALMMNPMTNRTVAIRASIYGSFEKVIKRGGSGQ
jgi:hypothetical protein